MYVQIATIVASTYHGLGRLLGLLTFHSPARFIQQATPPIIVQRELTSDQGTNARGWTSFKAASLPLTDLTQGLKSVELK